MIPHALEMEQCLLGCFLVDPSTLSVLDLITADDFCDPRHQTIYRAIRHQYEKEQPVDIVIISQLLKERSELNLAGGRAYLADLSLAVTSTLHAPYYVRILNEKSLLRKLIRAGHEITAIGYSDAETKECIRKAKMALSSAISKHQILEPFSEHQCSQLIHRHGDQLWDKFWDYMSEQVDAGASLQYVKACHNALANALAKTNSKSELGSEQNLFEIKLTSPVDVEKFFEGKPLFQPRRRSYRHH